MTINLPFVLADSASAEVDAQLSASGSILFNLLIILLLVFLNGFFVASEFALVKVRTSQLDALEALLGAEPVLVALIWMPIFQPPSLESHFRASH